MAFSIVLPTSLLEPAGFIVLQMGEGFKGMAFNGDDEENELLVPRSNTIVEEEREETIR